MVKNFHSVSDLIRARNNASRGRGQGAPHQGCGGPRSFGGRIIVGPGIRRVLQGSLGVNSGPSDFAVAKSFRRTKNFPWQQDLFEDSLGAAGLSGHENGTKLHLSNLDHGVSNDDIRELFTEIGELKRYAIHYDKNGEPSGSAEVVYTKRSDAFAAMRRYNNVLLDGRPIKIEITTPESRLPVSARINMIRVDGAPSRKVPISARMSVIGGANGAPARRVVTLQGGGRLMPMVPVNRGFIQRPRGGMRYNMGRGRGRGWSQAQGQGLGLHRSQGGAREDGSRVRGVWKPKEKSAAELDKELEKYHAEAMEIS